MTRMRSRCPDCGAPVLVTDSLLDEETLRVSSADDGKMLEVPDPKDPTSDREPHECEVPAT